MMFIKKELLREWIAPVTHCNIYVGVTHTHWDIQKKFNLPYENGCFLHRKVFSLLPAYGMPYEAPHIFSYLRNYLKD